MAKSWQSKSSHTEQELADYEACVERLNAMRNLAIETAGGNFTDNDLMACMSCYNFMRYHLKWGVPGTRKGKLSYVTPPDDGYCWSHRQRQGAETPDPRQYYKCTHPRCPARKVLDRNPDDYHELAITYYGGDHSHEAPGQSNAGTDDLDGTHGVWDAEDEEQAHRTDAPIYVVRQEVPVEDEEEEGDDVDVSEDEELGREDDDWETEGTTCCEEDTAVKTPDMTPAREEAVPSAQICARRSSRSKATQQVAAMAAAAAAAGWVADAKNEHDTVMPVEVANNHGAKEVAAIGGEGGKGEASALLCSAVQTRQQEVVSQSLTVLEDQSGSVSSIAEQRVATPPAKPSRPSSWGPRRALITLPDDGHRWRYALRPNDTTDPPPSASPLLYLECTYPHCTVTKTVTQPTPHSTEYQVVYGGGEHNHEQPPATLVVAKAFAKRPCGARLAEPSTELTWHDDVESWGPQAPTTGTGARPARAPARAGVQATGSGGAGEDDDDDDDDDDDGVRALDRKHVRAARAARAMKRAKRAEKGDEEVAPPPVWQNPKASPGVRTSMRACSCCGKVDGKPKYGIPALVRNLALRWEEKATSATALQKAEYQDLIRKLETVSARGALPGEGETPGLCHTCYAHKRRAMRWRQTTYSQHLQVAGG